MRFSSALLHKLCPLLTRPKNVLQGKYGGRNTVAALSGDGIGPEMMEHVQRIFTFANIPVDFEHLEINSSDTSDTALDNVIKAVQRNGIAIKGNIETKFDDPLFKSRNVELRRRLDLYSNVLHCVSIPNVPARHNDLDIVLIRENTEGEYSGLEHEAIPGVVESLKIVTRTNVERIAKFAFDYAIQNDREKVIVVHKANIQKLADGLFLKICKEYSERPEYKSIKYDAMIVDNASMQLVSRPQQFNGGIMLMPNLYGNVISNIACGLVGGPGLVSGINIGDKYAVFETGTRSSGTALVNKNIANPASFIRAAIDMLSYLGLDNHAEMLSTALYDILSNKKIHTPDIGGHNKTSEMVEGVIDNLNKMINK